MKKEDLRIVFFGTPDFAVESLRAIVDNGYNVVGVVTATDKAAGRGRRISCSPVKTFAEERGLRILQPEKLKDEAFVERLRALDADLFVVIAFRMLPEVVWSMPRLGTFNLHASLLPKYRGAAPINRAVMAGEKTTGVTTFFLQHEIDTGDIINRVEIEIGDDEDAGSVHDRLMEIGARLTVDTIGSIIDGTLVTTPQDTLIDNGAECCPAPKIFKETGKVDWTLPASAIHNHVRGLAPYPGAWSVLHSDNSDPSELKIFKTCRTDRVSTLAPGEILEEKGHMYVGCGENSMLRILEVQPAGRKRMDADAFLRGARLVNTRL